jgi:hypothetical protein
MLKKLVIAVLFCLLPAFPQPVPKPHGGGDYWIYNEHTWLDWEVTCPELVGRITPAWPQDDQAPGALLKIDWLVPQWPVVAKFVKGTRLHAVPDEGGGILIKDIDGSSWMKVDSGKGGFCFVRANSKYIRPVKPLPPPAPPMVEPPSPQSPVLETIPEN